MFEKQLSVKEFYAKLSKEDRKAVKNFSKAEKIDFIPTGSWVIDMLIGDGTGTTKDGGLPRGHITEVFGDESCGKTTLGISACRKAQEMGGTAVWADFERTFSKNYAKGLGLDLSPEKFIFFEPDNFEHGCGLINQVIATKPWIIVVDSVAAMLPKACIEGEMDEAVSIGLQARLMTRFLGIFSKILPETNTCLLFTNQLRSVIKTNKYDPGPNEETSGGRALKYYTSVRIKMRKSTIEYVKVPSLITATLEKEPLNIQVKVSIAKNKIDKPYYSGPVYVRFGEGFDNLISIIKLAINTKVIKKSGAYLRFDVGDKTIFNEQGEEALRKVLEKDSKIVDLLTKAIKPRVAVDEEVKKDMEAAEEEQPENIDMDSLLQKTSENFVKEKKSKGKTETEEEVKE